MKCPYQLMKVTMPEKVTGYTAEVTKFGDCVAEQCPFYYKIHKEHCARAEKEYMEKVEGVS